MYIGGTDVKSLHHIIWEAVDNSTDEYLAGYGTKIEIELCGNGSMKIRDYGRGIPVGTKKEGQDVLEVLLTKLHAGGKFGGSNSSYVASGGLHGI